MTHAPRPNAWPPCPTVRPDGMARSLLRVLERLRDMPVRDRDDAAYGGLGLRAGELCEATMLSLYEEPRRALQRGALGRPDIAQTLTQVAFPAAATRLGEGWATDRLSFAEVTIAATRMQDTLRRLGPMQGVPDPGTPSITMIVPDRETHTLAPSMAADRLRRLGVRVRLIAGLPDPMAAEMALAGSGDAVLISAGSRRTLMKVPALVSALRHRARRPLRIILGGPALIDDLALARTCGADYVTSEAERALAACGVAVGVEERAAPDMAAR